MDKEEQFRQFFEKFLAFFEKMDQQRDFSGAVAQHQITTSMEQFGSRVAKMENDICELSVETAKTKEIISAMQKDFMNGETIKTNFKNITNEIKSLKNIIKVGTLGFIGCLATITGFLIKVILFP